MAESRHSRDQVYEDAGQLRACLDATCILEYYDDEKKLTYKATGCFIETFVQGKLDCVIITSNHFIKTENVARKVKLYFKYESGLDRIEAYLWPGHIFLTNEELDVTSIGCDDRHIKNELKIQPVSFRSERCVNLSSGDSVSLFHHPNGIKKQKSCGSVRHIHPPYVYYTGKIEEGSSGCLLLKDSHPVAVHHSKSEGLNCNQATLNSEVLMWLNTENYTRPLPKEEIVKKLQQISEDRARSESTFPDYSEDDWKIQIISEGEFSKVHLYTHRKTDKKRIRKDETRFNENCFGILKVAEHDRIVKCYSDKIIDATRTMFIEHMPGGTLLQRIREVGMPLSEDHFIQLFRHILAPLEYLHEHGITHKRLTADHVYVDVDYKACKITYFPGEIQRKSQEDIYYASPELLNNEGHGKESDVWSSGAIAVLMVTTKLPLYDIKQEEAVKGAITKRRYRLQSSSLRKEGVSFVNSIFERYPTNRPTAGELLRHGYLRDDRMEID